MRQVIRKRIRRTADGLGLAADLNVEIEANVGQFRSPAPPRPSVPEDERPPAPDAPARNDPDPKGQEP